MTPDASFSTSSSDQRLPVAAWARRDLGERFGLVIAERIPQEMLDMVAIRWSQD